VRKRADALLTVYMEEAIPMHERVFVFWTQVLKALLAAEHVL
jgi:hypothetical protein